MRSAKAQARLRMCAVESEPWLSNICYKYQMQCLKWRDKTHKNEDHKACNNRAIYPSLTDNSDSSVSATCY